MIDVKSIAQLFHSNQKCIIAFLEKQAGHNYVIFFQQNNFGHIRNLCLPPKRKEGFHFFCPLEKKTEQATTQCCQKLAI